MPPPVDPGSFDSYSSVWIEITSEAHGHGGDGWRLGECLWSPTKGEEGQDRYALMREPEAGDLVLHFTEGEPGSEVRRQVVGWSTIASQVTTADAPPPEPGPWAGRTSYYRIELRDHVRIDYVLNLDELVSEYGAELRAEIDEDAPEGHAFTRYGEGVRLAAGLYLRRCSERLYLLLFERDTNLAWPAESGGFTAARVELDSVWQRVREWAHRAAIDRTAVPTLKRGTVNVITDVLEGSIGRRSADGTTNSSRVGRADVEAVWRALRTRGETGILPGVLYFAPALIVAALDEVEHVGGGLIRLVRTQPGLTPISEPPPMAHTVDAEAMHVEHFPVSGVEELRIAARRESKLVADYCSSLQGRADPKRRRYGLFVCDVFVVDRAHLIEAKADSSRASIRMAIGQLMDYRYLEPGEVELAILLPCRPADELERLLRSLDIACIWRTGTRFEDNRGGAFT